MNQWCSIAASISWNLHWSTLAILILSQFALLGCVAAWIYYRFSAGQVLLDCGPHPQRSTFLTLGLFFLFLSLGGAFANAASGKMSLTPHLFGVSFATCWLILATGRLQMRERGIWQYWILLPWSKIAFYRWAENSMLVLNVDYLFSLKDPIPIPHQQRCIVDNLLLAHLDIRQANLTPKQ